MENSCDGQVRSIPELDSTKMDLELGNLAAVTIPQFDTPRTDCGNATSTSLDASMPICETPTRDMMDLGPDFDLLNYFLEGETSTSLDQFDQSINTPVVTPYNTPIHVSFTPRVSSYNVPQVFPSQTPYSSVPTPTNSAYTSLDWPSNNPMISPVLPLAHESSVTSRPKMSPSPTSSLASTVPTPAHPLLSNVRHLDNIASSAAMTSHRKRQHHHQILPAETRSHENSEPRQKKSKNNENDVKELTFESTYKRLIKTISFINSIIQDYFKDMH